MSAGKANKLTGDRTRPHAELNADDARTPSGASAQQNLQQSSPEPADTALGRQAFDRQYNLAFLDESVGRATVGLVLRHYAVSVLLYGSLLVLFTLNPWFQTLLSVSFKEVTGYQVYYRLFGAYVLLAPVLLLIGRPRSLWASKNLMIASWLGRCVRTFCGGNLRQDRNRIKPTYRETHALMFLLIKVVYGPLMLHSTLFELNRIPEYLFQLNFRDQWLGRLDIWYMMFVSGIFVLDSSVFFIGYTSESGLLRNRLRYAETNVFRILICIACYSPFNLVTYNLLGPSNYDVGMLYKGDLEHPVTWVLRGLAVLSLLLLISSSLFLFTRASNLTNRGIVRVGPYALVRHPGYIAKNLFWLTTCIPMFYADTGAMDFSWTTHALLCLKVTCGLFAWGVIYFLRAITEEQFLRRDPDYVAYCRKVRYRFIPGIY